MSVPRETRLFVTGTGTAVGKTWVTARLLEHWRSEGRRVAGLKAVESGCSMREGRLAGADDDLLVAAAGGSQIERCRYLFEQAVAPGVAAEDRAESIDLAAIADQVTRLKASAEVVLVEGAGGWLVPLGQGRMIADLAVILALPVLVVGSPTLGSINHSLLTVEAIRRRGLACVAVALSMRAGDDPEMAERNRREISRAGELPVVIVRDRVDELATVLSG